MSDADVEEVLAPQELIEVKKKLKPVNTAQRKKRGLPTNGIEPSEVQCANDIKNAMANGRPKRSIKPRASFDYEVFTLASKVPKRQQ
jgi:hypothetical protein